VSEELGHSSWEVVQNRVAVRRREGKEKQNGINKLIQPNLNKNVTSQTSRKTDRNGKVMLDKTGKPISTREYEFTRPDGSKIIIQEHSAGPQFGENWRPRLPF